MDNARVIYTCSYHKAKKLTGMVEYISKRDGVDMSINNGFIDYLSKRPKSHGLFSSEHDPPRLSDVKNELANHKGNVYSSVISLRRKDAERLGYNNAVAWQQLITSKQFEIARNHKIPIKDLKWYAAFHNEEHHPHVHLLVWNANPHREYLTEQGIENLRSEFANEIFNETLMQYYEDKTYVRDELKAEFKKTLTEMNFECNPQIELKMLELREKLSEISGKKQYGYLKPPLKKLVDEIVQEIAKDESVDKLYKQWCALQSEIIGIYQMPDELPPLWELQEFRSIKNAAIAEVLKPRKQGNEQDMTAALQNVLSLLAGEMDNDYDKKHKKWSRNLDSKDYKKLAKKKLAQGMKLE